MKTEELIKELRRYVQSWDAYRMGPEFADTITDAADTIERMERQVMGYTKEAASAKREKERLQCVEYYQNTCDGAQDALGRLCKAFKAIRSIDLPQKLEGCLQSLQTLSHGCMVLVVWNVLLTALLVKICYEIW